MSRRLFALVVATGTIALATPGRAELPGPCAGLEEIATLLDRDFAERPIARGLQADGTLINVFASEQGETFTVVIADPAGMACVVADGTVWEILAPRDASWAGTSRVDPAPRHAVAAPVGATTR